MITVRPYRADDAAILADLYARSVRYFGPRNYSQEQVEIWAGTACAERIAQRSSDGRQVFVAVNAQGAVLGWGDLEPDGHLDFLYSAPEAEGMGVGSTICTAIEEQARADRIQRIYVEASELARPLFEKRGFTVICRNDFAIEGVAIHNFSMEKTERSRVLPDRGQ
jgi:putative acetyltransferase